jgi:hypothetical protein
VDAPYPHVGFSRARRRIVRRVSTVVDGRPCRCAGACGPTGSTTGRSASLDAEARFGVPGPTGSGSARSDARSYPRDLVRSGVPCRVQWSTWVGGAASAGSVPKSRVGRGRLVGASRDSHDDGSRVSSPIR